MRSQDCTKSSFIDQQKKGMRHDQGMNRYLRNFSISKNPSKKFTGKSRLHEKFIGNEQAKKKVMRHDQGVNCHKAK